MVAAVCFQSLYDFALACDLILFLQVLMSIKTLVKKNQVCLFTTWPFITRKQTMPQQQ